jgi:hypothetical protein
MGSQNERSIGAIFAIVFDRSVEPPSIDAAVEWGPPPAVISPTRSNRVPGEEANWFGSALLIWEEASLYIVEHRLTIDGSIAIYAVGRDLSALQSA